MIPDKYQVIACPHCEGVTRYLTLKSANSTVSKAYTDGKTVSPMSPTPPAVVRCRHCQECYWLEEAKEVGTMGLKETTSRWAAVDVAEEPEEEEYYKAIQAGLGKNQNKRRLLRTLAWWRGNDRFRESVENQAMPFSPSEIAKGNLEELMGLLSDLAENDVLMQAEILRALGRFDEAQKKLDQVKTKEFLPTVNQLRKLCRQGVTTVRQIENEEPQPERVRSFITSGDEGSKEKHGRIRPSTSAEMNRPWWKFWSE